MIARFAAAAVAALVAAVLTLAAKEVSAIRPPGPRPPQPPCLLVPVDLALLPDSSLNALYQPCGRNFFGLTLLAGRAGELRGVQLGLGLNVAQRDAVGVQVAVGGNVAGEDLWGIQLGGLLNAAGERASGLQVAGLGNAVGGDLRGIQVGGLFNVAGEDASGIQVGGLFNAAGQDLRGIQVGGLFNAAGQDATGIQVGGLFNAAGQHFRGIQASGLLNAVGELSGVQLAGGMNAAGKGTGLQLAGGHNRVQEHLSGVQIAVVNLGCDVSGGQIGIVNVAGRVHGFQLGVVNVADDVDVPLGLSFVRRGERAVEVWGGEAVSFTGGLRLGSRRVYTLAGLSVDPFRDATPRGPVGGLGVKTPLGGRVALLIEALATALFFDDVDDPALLAQTRARVAIDVTAAVAVTVGASWNVFVSDDVDGAGLPLGLDRVSTSGDTLVRQWPGITAGVAFGF